MKVLNKQISKLTKEYVIFLKHIQKTRSTEEDVKEKYNEILNRIDYITEYVDQNSEAKTIEHDLNSYAKKVINSSEISNELRKVFLIRASKRFNKVIKAILVCGLDKINYNTIKESFEDEERELHKSFNCKEMCIEPSVLNNLIQTQIGTFIIDLQEIVKQYKNSKRVIKFKDLSKELLRNVIERIKELNTEGYRV